MTAEDPKPPKKASQSPWNEVGQKTKIKKKKTKNFRTGAWATREGGSWKGEKVSKQEKTPPTHTPHRPDQGGATEPQSAMQ